MEQIQPSDIVIETSNKKSRVEFAKSVKKKTGYPFDLTEEQIIRLIYFFGARKLVKKSLATTGGKGDLYERFTSLEKKALEEFFSWFGFVAPTRKLFISAYKALTLKFREILEFLRIHPAYITTEIYQALKTGGYENVISNIVLVIDENKNIVPRLVEPKHKNLATPLGEMEKTFWRIQEVALNKIEMILNDIKLKDVKKATLGNKARALRDIYAMLHMIKQTNKSPNLTLINLNVNTAEPKEKLITYSEYLNRNRQE